jgi:hypothetical protein
VGLVSDQIDDLYRQPLDNFVAARNALAKTLSGEAAQQVRKLVKPTVVPWAVNQLYWRARPAYDRLIASGVTLRKAQIASLEGQRSDLPAANEAHRRAISDASKESQRLAAESGAHPDSDTLMRTLEALSLAVEPPSPPGRLTEPLRPAGFEALAGIQPTGVPSTGLAGVLGATAAMAARASQTSPGSQGSPASPAGSTESPKLSPAEKRKREAELKRQEEELKKREAERKQRELELKEAESTLERAAAAESKARDVWERAHDELIAARQRVAEIKKK